MTNHRIYRTSFASVYPHYVAKAEKKGRTKAEVDEIVRWLTGYSQKGLEAEIANGTDFETFFAKAPRPNSARKLITGVVCAWGGGPGFCVCAMASIGASARNNAAERNRAALRMPT